MIRFGGGAFVLSLCTSHGSENRAASVTPIDIHNVVAFKVISSRPVPCPVQLNMSLVDSGLKDPESLLFDTSATPSSAVNPVHCREIEAMTFC